MVRNFSFLSTFRVILSPDLSIKSASPDVFENKLHLRLYLLVICQSVCMNILHFLIDLFTSSNNFLELRVDIVLFTSGYSKLCCGRFYDFQHFRQVPTCVLLTFTLQNSESLRAISWLGWLERRFRDCVVLNVPSSNPIPRPSTLFISTFHLLLYHLSPLSSLSVLRASPM